MNKVTCIVGDSRRLFLASTVVLATSLILGGCATAPVSPEADRAALLQRASEYWALVQVNDNVAAWAYEEASKDPKTTIEAYLKRGGIVYDEIEVRGVRSLDGDTAMVDVWMRYSAPLIRVKGLEGVVQDEWKRIDGVWHHVLRRSLMFPSSKS